MGTKKKNDTQLDKAVKDLTEILERRHETANAISRKGNKIVVPEFMSLPEAADAILDYQKQMEEDTEKCVVLTGHPHDCLNAFNTAMTTTFGSLVGTSSVAMSFFGPMRRLSCSTTIQIGPDETITVPFGTVKVPGLPVSIQIGVKQASEEIMKSQVVIDFEYRKKFEPLVEMIEEEAKKVLKNNSIFLHKAIDSKFNFLSLDGITDERVIYTRQQRKDVEAHLFNYIVNTDEMLRRGVSLKHAVLLYGTYGTSKTLTALLAAVKCTQHNWTFINVNPGDSISQSYEFAKKYQPCLVFFEDIDRVASGHRDEALDRILNTCDGILSKSAQVVTVMTTNNVDKIQKGMMRPGRIDVLLELGALDAESIVRMVQLYCPDVEGELDGEELMEAGRGFTPAFVTEACQRALRYSIADGRSHVNQEDIAASLRGLRAHFEAVNKSDWLPSETLDGRMKSIVRPLVHREAVNLGHAIGRGIGVSIAVGEDNGE